jgi:ketosteroid isomerase-like protein
VSAADSVLAAARARAAALAAGDVSRLAELLHPDFRWTSHTGEQFGRETYLASNTGGRTTWKQQELGEPEVLAVGSTAVLRTVVTDTIEANAGGTETFRMPMTQVWVLGDNGWQCLAGHAGPRLAS